MRPAVRPWFAVAENAAGSDTVGWLARLPPAIKLVIAAAKLSIPPVSSASPEIFAVLVVSRRAICASFGALAAAARPSTIDRMFNPDPAPSALDIAEVSMAILSLIK